MLRTVIGPGTAAADPDAIADGDALRAALPTADAALQVGDPVFHRGAEGIARVATGADAVPAAWAEALPGAVWVPSRLAAAALREAGVDAAVVAPAIDTERFGPEGPGERAHDANGFVFLANLDWTRAAGWDVLVRAWAEEFTADENVSLVIRAWSTLGYTPALVADGLMTELDRLGVDPGDIADLILEVLPAPHAPSPESLRGADCIVVPARADAWGRRTLEALACGVPLIATDWGVNGELLPPDAQYAIPSEAAGVPLEAARELPQLAGARWGEPDVPALRRALRAVADDRLSAAEAGLLGRIHVLERPAPAIPAPAAPVERAPHRSRTGARPEDVSFVLQGPIDRAGRGRTADACAAIRAHFPGAEIVISTWEGTDTSGLDCDAVVHSADPGIVGPNTYNVNTNRQIDSSLAGVQAATRPLVAKVRSDILFLSDALLGHWRRWEERSDELRLFEHRVLVPNVFARRPSFFSPYPMHPSDWSYFGTREDLELLFDVPHMRRGDSEVDAKEETLTRYYHALPKRPSYTPEQWIWTQAVRKAEPKARIGHVFDLTPKTLRLTELSFANNFAVLDTYTQYGIWCPKYPGPNRVFEDLTLFQHEDWHELYEIHCLGETLAAEEVEPVLTALTGGECEVEAADVSRLRRAGFSWVAQLLATAIAGSRINRDSTTGGAHRWHLDGGVLALAEEQLPAAAAEALDRIARSSRKADEDPMPVQDRPSTTKVEHERHPTLR
jgi:hypothetical protein